MNLPQLNGAINQSGFFIYAAADTKYFATYGIPLINSVLKNTDYGCHIHIYDPTPAQLEWCASKSRVSVSWEFIEVNQFDTAITLWSRSDLPDPYCSRKNKMLGIKSTDQPLPGHDVLVMWLYKTYYACMRFVRLAELLHRPTRLLSIDIDGIVRKNFDINLDDGKDFYLYLKEKGGHLAGAILTAERSGSLRFVKELGQMIRDEILQDNIYWFLDQNCLDNIVSNYKKGLLPINYIDWHMSDDSAIWSAKGKRKSRDVFINEMKRYL